jgi:hypothetical protein
VDLLGGWTTARRCPRTPGRGSAPVKRHSRIAVAGEQPHPQSRMGRSRRQTRGSTPNSWDRGPSARRGTAPLISPPVEEVGSDSPGRGSRHLAPSRPPMHRAEHSPVPLPLPQMGSPSRPQALGGPESFSGIETAHLGSSQNLLYSGASRAGAALAHSATPPPPSTPNLPAPTREPLFRGTRAGRTLPGGASRRREHLHSPRGPSHIRRDARPDTAPFVPRACRSRPHLTTIQNDVRDVT